MTDTAVRRGMRFVHARQLDTTWRPGPGQRYADGPKQVMEITRVATGTAYYRPAGRPHRHRVPHTGVLDAGRRPGRRQLAQQ
jgi:hypothetical protein